jgi:hypothetical protein
MKLEKQVCTLEQAKQLKKLGIAQTGLWSYFKAQSHAGFCLTDMALRHVWILTGNPYDREDILFTSAFSVAELGVMLPQTIKFCKTQKASIQLSRFNAFTIYYNRHSSGSNVCMTESYNEAEARAKMLIHLLESNFITAEEVNQRLLLA